MPGSGSRRQCLLVTVLDQSINEPDMDYDNRAANHNYFIHQTVSSLLVGAVPGRGRPVDCWNAVLTIDQPPAGRPDPQCTCSVAAAAARDQQIEQSRIAGCQHQASQTSACTCSAQHRNTDAHMRTRRQPDMH